MQNTKYDRATMMTIFEGDNRTFTQTKEYINKYFFLTEEGNYYIWDGTDFRFFTKD
jgi:hypothetical protein